MMLYDMMLYDMMLYDMMLYDMMYDDTRAAIYSQYYFNLLIIS